MAFPLLYDRPFIEALELDIAARYTDYSLSGGVNTWKASVNYIPVSDVRLRATRSRDIRAANISELFTGGSQGIGTARDPATGQTIDVVTLSGGNPALEPEVADTITAGIVYQPEAIPGFSLSMDHYSIDIDGAVSNFGRQESLDECFRGNQSACNLISVNGTQYSIDLPYMNLDKFEVAGIDYEASYDMDLLGGNVAFRLLASRQYRNQRTTPGGQPVNSAGETGRSDNPIWQGKFSAVYRNENITLFSQVRYTDSGAYDLELVEGVDINRNKVASASYVDVTGTYRFGAAQQYEAYLSVNNLFDRDPPFAPAVSGTHLSWSNFTLFDTIGRYYNLGFRYSF
jgi:outer membrane receptor protein involved in Fe transport